MNSKKDFSKQKKKKSFSTDEEVIRLEEELREAKVLIKSLTKRLGKYEKIIHSYDDIEQKVKEHENKKQFEDKNPIKNTTETCSACAKGKMEITVLAGRQFSRCPICGYRTKATKL